LIDFEFVVFHDHNPFLVFDSNGHITYSNKAAEYLTTTDTIDKLYNLALQFAPKSYGAKYSCVDIQIDIFHFFAINVLYQDDENIAIMLYNKAKKSQKVTLQGFSKSDINLLLKTNIEIFKMQSNAKIKLFSDFDLPPFQIHQNNLSILIQKIFECFKEKKEIAISLHLKIGQKVIIENKRYPIVSLKVQNKELTIKNPQELYDLAQKNYAKIYIEKEYIELDLPMIQ